MGLCSTWLLTFLVFVFFQIKLILYATRYYQPWIFKSQLKMHTKCEMSTCLSVALLHNAECIYVSLSYIYKTCSKPGVAIAKNWPLNTRRQLRSWRSWRSPYSWPKWMPQQRQNWLKSMTCLATPPWKCSARANLLNTKEAETNMVSWDAFNLSALCSKSVHFWVTLV